VRGGAVLRPRSSRRPVWKPSNPRSCGGRTTRLTTETPRNKRQITVVNYEQTSLFLVDLFGLLLTFGDVGTVRFRRPLGERMSVFDAAPEKHCLDQIVKSRQAPAYRDLSKAR